MEAMHFRNAEKSDNICEKRLHMAAEKFETVLKKLEEVVQRLEGGELSLDDSLKAFEEGVKYANFCARKLDEAESRVELLLKQKDGTFVKKEFRPEEES
jgi:exodeoxyribonuclease VII small subunit